VSNAYTEGEMQELPTDLADAGYYLLVATLILFALSLAHAWKWFTKPAPPRGILDEIAPVEQRERPPPLPLAATLLMILAAAALLFLNFKSGYVRHDGHEMSATAALAIIAVTASTALWPRIKSRLALTFLGMLAFGAIGLSWSSQQAFTYVSGPGCILIELLQAPSRAANNLQALLGNPAPMNLPEPYAAPVPPPPLPLVQGTVDIYPWGQRLLLSQGLDYHPRPVFQGYLAFTRPLMELNARFLAGPNAPRSILFDLDSIDGHYNAQDDSLSLPELLTRYDPADARTPHLLLQKSAQPRPFTLVPLATEVGGFDHWMHVPESDAPVWVTVDLRLTPLGQLATFLYKPPMLYLGVHTHAVQPLTFRFQRQAAQAGFLLSPVLSDRMTFAMLYSPQWKQLLAGNQVTDMAINVESATTGDTPFYHDQFELHFFALRYPHVDISSLPGLTDYLDLRQTFKQITVFQTPPDTPPQLLKNPDDGKFVIEAAAPTRILIPAPLKAREFHFAFGMPSSTYSVPVDPTDGVIFRVYLVDTKVGNQLSSICLWTRQLDPTDQSADRGRQEATIPLPQDRPDYGVLLEAAPGPKNQRDNLYWSNFNFR
ncbi:MAG: hypothetical protein ABSF29_10835, partial [Tepidisphaeraceae bacterium]